MEKTLKIFDLNTYEYLAFPLEFKDRNIRFYIIFSKLP